MVIRVLHVVGIMDAGGAETMIMNLYRNIDRSKVQFDFLVHRDKQGFYDKEINDLGGKIYKAMPINMKNYFKYKKMLDTFFKEHKEYKIVHSHISILSLINLKIAKKNNVPIRIAHSHESHLSLREHDIKRRPIIYFSKKIINKYPNIKMACAVEAGNWLFGDNSTVKVLNNSIDSKQYVYNSNSSREIRESLHLTDKNFIVGHIGRFSKQKNHDFIIDIFKEIHDINNDAVLMLVGDGELKDEIEKKVKKLRLAKSVIFTGIRSDIPKLLSSMDVFLFPSLFEGLPVSLIEAQASGIVSIISDNVSKEVKITNQIEFLSLKDSPVDWANKAIKYDNNHKRINTYNQIKKAKYDIEQNAQEMENFYLEEYNKNRD